MTLHLNQQNLIELIQKQNQPELLNQEDSNQSSKQNAALKVIIRIKDIKEITDLEKQRANQPLFDDLVELSLKISELYQLDSKNLLKLLHFIGGNSINLKKFTLTIGKTYIRYQYQAKRQEGPEGFIHTVKLIKELIPQMNFCNNLKIQVFIGADSFIYNSLPEKNNKESLLISLDAVIPGQKEISAELFQNTFENLTYLELKDSQIYKSHNEFTNQLILHYKTLQSLKLTLTNNRSSWFYHYSEQASNILKLKDLKRLDLHLNKSYADILLNQFNRIEQSSLEESNIQSINIELSLYSYELNKYKFSNLNFSFLKYFRHLKKLSIIIYQTEAVEIVETLPYLSQLEKLKLNLVVSQNNLDIVMKSYGNQRSLKKLSLLFSSKVRNLDTSGFPMSFQNLICLEKLKIKLDQFQQVDQNGLKFLGSSFIYLTKLKKLNLTISNQHVCDKDFIELTSRLQDIKQLKKLVLQFKNDNEFGDNALFEFSSQLTHLTTLKDLQLVLQSRNISRVGTLKLQHSIKEQKQISKVILDISDFETILLQYFGLVDKSLQPLIRNQYNMQIYLENSDLLSFSWKFQFLKRVRYDKTVTKLPEISTIYLIMKQTSFSSIRIDGIFSFLTQLPKLTSLYLEFQKIDLDHMVQFGRLTEQLIQLKDLSLHFEACSVPKEGMKSVYSSLKKLTQLEYLSLISRDYEEINEENNFFPSLKNLKQLRICFDPKCQRLYQSIGEQSSLRIIILQNDQEMDQDKFTYYLSCLAYFSKLKFLHLMIDVKMERKFLDSQKQQLFTLLGTFDHLVNLSISRYYQLSAKKDKPKFFQLKRLMKLHCYFE